MSVVAPTANARNSDSAAAEMDGPTSASACAAFSSTPSSGAALERRSKALTTMNMLSTPMARIRNGTTSVTIIVIEMPAAEHMPMDASTEHITMTMPCRPSSARDLTGCGNLPSATEM